MNKITKLRGSVRIKNFYESLSKNVVDAFSLYRSQDRDAVVFFTSLGTRKSVRLDRKEAYTSHTPQAMGKRAFMHCFDFMCFVGMKSALGQPRKKNDNQRPYSKLRMRALKSIDGARKAYPENTRLVEDLGKVETDILRRKGKASSAQTKLPFLTVGDTTVNTATTQIPRTFKTTDLSGQVPPFTRQETEAILKKFNSILKKAKELGFNID